MPENPYEPPQEVARPKRANLPVQASCGYTLAVILAGIIAGVMFVILVSMIGLLVGQWVAESYFGSSA